MIQEWKGTDKSHGKEHREGEVEDSKQSVKKTKGQVPFVFQIPNRTESLHRTSRG